MQNNNQKVKMYYSVDKDNASPDYCIYTIDPSTYETITYAKNFNSYDTALSYYSNQIKANMTSTGCETVITPSCDHLKKISRELKANTYYDDWLKSNESLVKSFSCDFVPNYSAPIKVSAYDQHKVNVINAYERAYHIPEENRMTKNDMHMDGLAVPKQNVSNTEVFERYGTVLEEDTLSLATRINKLFEEYDKYNHKGESADRGRTVSDYNKSINNGQFDVNISGSIIDIATCGVEKLEADAKVLVNQYSLQVKENAAYNAEKLSYTPKVRPMSSQIYKNDQSENLQRKRKQ